MRFRFDAQQRSFAESVRALLARECSPAIVRAEWEGAPRSGQRWQKLADAGLCGLLVDERHGGTGLSEIDAVLAVEETGRAALPDPLVEIALVAAPLLAAIAPEPLQQRWLPAIAAGGARVAVSLAASGRYCVDADRADLLLLQHGDSIHAIEPRQTCITLQPSLDAGRPRFSLEWQPGEQTQLATGQAARDAIDAAFDRAAFGAAAQLLGLAATMIDMAAEHARSREQFGRPIGSFQAVKHLLADALMALEFARPTVYRAAWSLATQAPDRGRDVSMAKAYASDAARTAARAALQIHGAIGYTWAHDLQMWLKRAESLAADWGSAAWHRERVAQTLVG
jgi:alkylation response protein AidB-like acyl-CoA dehydrogenase